LDVKNLPERIVRASASVNIFVRDVADAKPTIPLDRGHFRCECDQSPFTSSDPLTTISAYCFGGTTAEDTPFQWSAVGYTARVAEHISSNWYGWLGNQVYGFENAEVVTFLKPQIFQSWDMVSENHYSYRGSRINMAQRFQSWVGENEVLFSVTNTPGGFYLKPQPHYNSFYDMNANNIVNNFAVHPSKTTAFVDWCLDQMCVNVGSMIVQNSLTRVKPAGSAKKTTKASTKLPPLDSSGLSYTAFVESFAPTVIIQDDVEENNEEDDY
jgi:hypothetical protein